MQMRLQEDSAMWEKLATCSNPSDLFKCQSEFTAKAGADYADDCRATHLGKVGLLMTVDMTGSR